MSDVTQHQILIGDRPLTLLFPDLLRPLTQGEREYLTDSIQAHGIQVAIKVDEDDGVIDGGHRLSIACELGLPREQIPMELVEGLTLDQKRELALSLNTARRQLSAEDRQ